MANLIRADLYKTLHRPYMFVLTGIVSLLAIIYNASMSRIVPRAAAMESTLYFLVVPIVITVMISDIVFAEENKYSILKNTISFGIGRIKLFFSKTISCIIIFLVAAIIVFAIFWCSAYLFLSNTDGFTAMFVSNYLERIALSLLLDIAAIFFAQTMVVIFKKGTIFMSMFIVLLLIPPMVLKLLGLTVSNTFLIIEKYTIYGQIEYLKSMPQEQLINAIWVTVIHIAVFSIIGAYVFKHQDIA